MADKCCNSNNDAENTENRTDSCCSSTNLEIKQENTSCCSSNKDSVNSFNSIPIFIQTETSCCSSNTSKETDKELAKINCCSSKTTNNEDETSEKTSCSSNEQQTSEEILNSLPSGEKMAYRVHGMDCPACAKTIEKGLSILKDIAEVKVNYSTAKMQVAASHLDAFIPIESEIKKLGYSIEPLNQTGNIKTFVIEGMDCGSCAKSIENHLNTLSTVKNVSVNFSTGKMKIEHSDSVENIISEVSKIGFKASLQSNKKSIQTNKNKSDNGLITLSGVLIALGFIGSFNGISPIMSTILYAIAMVISGFKPVKSAFYAIKSRSLDMNVLMSAAAIGAALIGEWLEGATVVWLFAIGNFLQTKSIERTRNSIRNLMDLAPPEAWVSIDSKIIKKPVEEITVGEIIIVKPGDKIPLDGEIIQGASSVNQAPITGESIPVDKEIGDTVYAGTINENGSLEIKVTKLVEDTTISKIIHLVEEAQEQKAPTEAFVDKFASIYTPIVFILALAIMVLPPILGFGTWGDWFYKGLELLVVACPCALVISTPVAIVSAIGNAAKNGVLIKGGTFLEKAGAITAIAFDKTGTLTEGKPKVTEIKTLHVTEDELLSIALTLEDYSTHPIAKAIVGYANEKGIQPKIGELFRSIVGKGVQATIEGNIYYGGNLKLFEEMNVSLDDVKNHVQEIQNKGKTVVIIGTQHQVIGIIAVSDTIRETTASTLKALKQSGVNQTVMLTGDNEGSAKMIASEANLTRYFANLLPEDKVDAIKKLQNEGHKVAMVGDGINDAPALATADLGIAMGGAGTDTAMETADIVLMADNLDKLPHTMKLSRKALTIIKQNIWFSVIIKVIALVLIFPGWLTLWMAVLSDTGAALIVILNALRLLKIK
ncbi:cadmium-translocating P-type ATPase [Peribacillus frigoritolerans]|uniref:heavy metal translocating P-type ATPase n=1 Tax=Peribacillus frigoritolerans TaxID=450367 RepID=UPI001EFE123F|nr:heavy metal translocating P-type ATPase [Peribacillus frigoritolerans]ULM95193.1 cadmium-translocating P-type ATPase [Peribacillus frigoritolerans]